ncbi:hypothetical protein L1987_11189 [Smallanthus sonchifolius]|uniref:Uncharacterized protein n=1 Tax=Smallanthus sonchifolius TaxID=185202 RepID=A0ACB9JB43_9ASTR|nr:hypothetical protein L1987_11189 [Smallanthus sonchifolius]
MDYNRLLEVSEPAAEALVNLSQNSDSAAKMIEIGLIKTTMDILYNKGYDITGLLVMFLVNLTQLDVGVESVLQVGDDKVQGLYVMKLVRSFCTSSNEKQDDPFGHVGSILVNVSKNKVGRALLLDSKRGLLKQIIRQFDSTSLLRKKGLQNLLLISEFLWPALLLPVAGNKVYNEQDTSKMPLELGSALSIEREPVTDPEIRIQALEAIYLITAFWSVNGPRILQIGYEEEEDPKVMGAYEQIGSLGEICKAIICLEIAANMNTLDIRELAIQFGCVRLIPLVKKGLSLYRERFIASLPPSRRASADFTRPVFTATGFYLCAKKHKVSTSVKDLCHDVFGVSKEKKDPKSVKVNRDLLDALPEKRQAEDDGYSSDESKDLSAYKKRKRQENHKYEEWKSMVVESNKQSKDKVSFYEIKGIRSLDVENIFQPLREEVEEFSLKAATSSLVLPSNLSSFSTTNHLVSSGDTRC